MNDWMLIGGLAAALFAAAFMLKALVSLAVQYLIFVGTAGAFFKLQTGAQSFAFLNPHVIADLAIIGGIAFVATELLLLSFFRKSKMRFLLLPAIGVVTTFLVTALWTN